MREIAQDVLAFDPQNDDALTLLDAVERSLAAVATTPSPLESPTPTPEPVPSQPTSFAGGRYEVKRFLGERGKTKVYLAHDSLLDWDAAIAREQSLRVADNLRSQFVRLAQLLEEAEDDILAYLAFPSQHWRQVQVSRSSSKV